RLFEGMADDALGAAIAEQFDLRGDFMFRARRLAPALADILAFAVFADDEHVDVIGALILEELRRAGQRLAWALAGPLVEMLANAEQRRQRFAIGQQITVWIAGRPWIAERAEQDGIECRELLQIILWRDLAMLFMPRV